MFIGQFCKLTGTTPKTIRYYESIGLLPEPARSGNYRIYDDTYVETIRQIKLAQAHGFSLREIQSLCEGANIKRGLPATRLVQGIQAKQAEIRRQMTTLKQLDQQLSSLETLIKRSPCNVDSDL